MISRIDIRDERIAADVWRLQHAAYRVEAQLIGFAGLPPLMDTIGSLQRCGETFFGCFDEDGELTGAVSLARDGDAAVICRMMVHPDYFRQGIARRLLQHAETNASGCAVIRVSTGSANAPALALYLSGGYVETGAEEVAPSVWLTHMEKVMA